jgi:ABC-type glutathione transport system ATPase component
VKALLHRRRAPTSLDIQRSFPSRDGENFILEAIGVSKRYAGRKGHFTDAAVSDVTLELRRGECIGLAGESGSGKTTLAHCLAGTTVPTAGVVYFRGRPVNAPGFRPSVPRVRGVQMVFQDPASSLNPRLSVGSVLQEVLAVHKLCAKSDLSERVKRLLAEVGLGPSVARRRPGSLSGGQQQRVAIARALAFAPEVIIADELVSALDASVQAQILNLLAELRTVRQLTVLLVTHDLAVARQACDRLAIMNRSSLVEMGLADEVFRSPSHSYTRSLLAAVPRLRSGPAMGDSR